MRYTNEKIACRIAVGQLRAIRTELNKMLNDLYDNAPGYAGEVESVKEATETAIKVLSGEPVD